MSLQSTRSTSQPANNDTESDYGSDFSPEDLILLDRFLIQANSEYTPALAIVDTDDEPGHGRFAHVPPRRQVDQAGEDEKEVFTQSSYDSSNPNIAKLVSATLAGPPSFGPELPFDEEYQTSEFHQEGLDSWEVWQDARKSLCQYLWYRPTH